MFNSDAKLFLNASNQASCAKNIINECIALINDVVISGDSVYNELKNCIENSGIDVLINIIENTRIGLFELDSSFANEYMSLAIELSNNCASNLSNVADDDKERYSIEMNMYLLEYHKTVLYILEKYEQSGQLTDDLKNDLEITRITLKRYEIEEKMAVLPKTDLEYINLFDEKSKIDIKLIGLNSDLSEEEKAVMLKNYNVSYADQRALLKFNHDMKIANDKLDNCEYGSKEFYQAKERICDLNINYLERIDDLYGLDGEHKDALESWEADRRYCHDAVEYADMNGFEKFFQNTEVFFTSVGFGSVRVLEQVGDGIIMLGGGLVGLFSEDVRDWTSGFVANDFTSVAYDERVWNKDLNLVIAYGEAHQSGMFCGEMLSTVALQFVPGGNLSTVGLHSAKGMGKASQSALNKSSEDNPITFYEAFGYGIVNGTIEGAATYLLYGKPGKSATSSNSITKKITDGKYVQWAANKLNLSGFANKLKIPELINSLGPGTQYYVKNYLTTKLVHKMIVSGSKEALKMTTTAFITKDHKIDTKGFTKDLLLSLGSTLFNELLVVPSMDSVLKKTVYKKEVDEAKTKMDELNKQRSEVKKELDTSDIVDDGIPVITGDDKVTFMEGLNSQIKELEKVVYGRNLFKDKQLYKYSSKVVKKYSGDDFKGLFSEDDN